MNVCWIHEFRRPTSPTVGQNSDPGCCCRGRFQNRFQGGPRYPDRQLRRPARPTRYPLIGGGSTPCSVIRCHRPRAPHLHLNASRGPFRRRRPLTDPHLQMPVRPPYPRPTAPMPQLWQPRQCAGGASRVHLSLNGAEYGPAIILNCLTAPELRLLVTQRCGPQIRAPPGAHDVHSDDRVT